jgi:hypothetical protein
MTCGLSHLRLSELDSKIPLRPPRTPSFIMKYEHSAAIVALEVESIILSLVSMSLLAELMDLYTYGVSW